MSQTQSRDSLWSSDRLDCGGIERKKEGMRCESLVSLHLCVNKKVLDFVFLNGETVNWTH